jgi:hypothetical protein
MDEPLPPPPHEPPPTAATLDPARLDRALIAVGVALLSGTLVMATFYSRLDDDLDVSNFLMGLAATIGLVGVAVGARVLVSDRERQSELVAWPGAFGAVGAGLMAAVLMDDHDLTGYVAGLVVIALSVGGYLLVRRGTFVVSAILGLLVVYLTIFDDVFDAGDLNGDNFGIVLGVAVLIFTLAVTAAGWLLPETRVLSAVVAGVIAVVSNAGMLAGLAVAASFARSWGSFDGADDPSAAAGLDLYNNDAWLILLFSLLLVGGWAYLTYTTGHVAFPLLMAGMCATVIPLVTAVIAVQHPTTWELVIGVVGGGVLVFAGFRAVGARRAQ